MSASAAERQTGQPIDLYAIVRSEQDGSDALVGTGAIADGLRMIAAGPYSAVIGSSTGPDLKGRSRTELAGLLIVHQKVIEQLMGTAWVLPVKFGTRMPDEKGYVTCSSGNAHCSIRRSPSCAPARNWRSPSPGISTPSSPISPAKKMLCGSRRRSPTMERL